MAKRPKVTTDASPLTSNPFAALLPEGEALPEAPPVAEAPKPAAPVPVPQALQGRLVVRRQKKGQGGKTVTCVEGLGAAAMAELLPRVKRELGCAGRVDGAVLVVGTGEHRRVAKWLEAAGADRVVIGN